MCHRTNHGDLVGNRRGVFQMLGEMRAGKLGGNRAERSAIFNWRVDLRIEGFLRRKTAGQINLDDGFCNRAFRGGGSVRFLLGGERLQFEHVAQRHAQATNQSDKKKFASIWFPGTVVRTAAVTFGFLMLHN